VTAENEDSSDENGSVNKIESEEEPFERKKTCEAEKIGLEENKKNRETGKSFREREELSRDILLAPSTLVTKAAFPLVRFWTKEVFPHQKRVLRG
jgi:hypothetical protein